MSNKRLADIWREITGSFPRAFILPSNPQLTSASGPQYWVYWMYSELAPQDSSLKTLYFETLGKIDSFTLLKHLAVINNHLIVERPSAMEIHQSLEQHYLRKNLLNEIARKTETGIGPQWVTTTIRRKMGHFPNEPTVRKRNRTAG